MYTCLWRRTLCVPLWVGNLEYFAFSLLLVKKLSREKIIMFDYHVYIVIRVSPRRLRNRQFSRQWSILGEDRGNRGDLGGGGGGGIISEKNLCRKITKCPLISGLTKIVIYRVDNENK